MKFRNPSNNHVEEVSSPGLWVFLFGCFYFMLKGVWGHAFLSFVLALFTVGLSWIVYPFLAAGIMRKHYLKLGWIEVT